MRSHLFALIFVGWFFSFQVNAGVKEYDSLVVYHYQKAQQWMRLGVYDSAHAEFKKLFKLELTIPDEAAFFYGINQFQRKKYKYAKQGFEKYIKLRGDTSSWSDSSYSYIERIDCMEKGYFEVKDSCGTCHGSGHVKGKCYMCKGIGKIYCTVCQGKGIVVTGNNMSQQYQTCYKCNGTGIVLCPTCNGTTYSDGECPTCKGNGFIFKRKECTHLK